MPSILRQREIVADEWVTLSDQAERAHSLIVPLARLRADPGRWRNWSGRLGARLAPAERVEDLAADLARLELVAVEFPSPGDGRGFSHGWLLRERFGFTGELRAVGPGVRQDLLFLMARCGFDSFELAPGEDGQGALRALERYDVGYQPGSAAVTLRRQRFPT